jgi:hypothetical protein
MYIAKSDFKVALREFSSTRVDRSRYSVGRGEVEEKTRSKMLRQRPGARRANYGIIAKLAAPSLLKTTAPYLIVYASLP